MRDDRHGDLRNHLTALGLLIAAWIPSCAPAQEGGLGDVLGIRGQAAAAQSREEFTASLVLDGPTGEVALRIAVKLPPEHYIYSTTPGQGPETRITVARAEGLEAIGETFAADHDAKIVDDPDLGTTVEKYFKQVTWTKRYRLAAGVAPERVAVEGRVKYQVCDTSSCRPDKFDFRAQLTGVSTVAPSARAVGASDTSRHFEQLVGPKGSQTVEGKWSVSLTPRQVAPGGEVTITVKAELNPGWHVYALDQRQLPDGSGPVPTVIGVTESDGLVTLGASFTGPQPIAKFSKEWEGLEERYHEGVVEWSRTFRVAEAASDGEIALAGKVAWGMCNSGGCEQATGFEFKGKLIVAEKEVPESVPLAVTEKFRLRQAQNVIEELRLDANNMPNVVRTDTLSNTQVSMPAGPARGAIQDRSPKVGPPAAVTGASQAAKTDAVLDKSQGLPLFLVAAVLAGFAALLTPCVFPMIPITVSFFQKQSEKQHHRPITMATVYCLGIIGTFTGLGDADEHHLQRGGHSTARQQLAGQSVHRRRAGLLRLQSAGDVRDPDAELAVDVYRRAGGSRRVHRRSVHGADLHPDVVHLHVRFCGCASGGGRTGGPALARIWVCWPFRPRFPCRSSSWRSFPAFCKSFPRAEAG